MVLAREEHTEAPDAEVLKPAEEIAKLKAEPGKDLVHSKAFPSGVLELVYVPADK